MNNSGELPPGSGVGAFGALLIISGFYAVVALLIAAAFSEWVY